MCISGYFGDERKVYQPLTESAGDGNNVPIWKNAASLIRASEIMRGYAPKADPAFSEWLPVD